MLGNCESNQNEVPLHTVRRAVGVELDRPKSWEGLKNWNPHSSLKGDVNSTFTRGKIWQLLKILNIDIELLMSQKSNSKL